jgi:hypothetical protein
MAAAVALSRVVGQYEVLSPPQQAATVHLESGRLHILPVYWHKEPPGPGGYGPLVSARVSLSPRPHLQKPAGAILEILPRSWTQVELRLRPVGGDLRYVGWRRRWQFFELEHQALDWLTSEMGSWVAVAA